MSGRVDLNAWFAELDRFADVPFMEDGRDQPPMPDEDYWFDPEPDKRGTGTTGDGATADEKPIVGEG